MSVVLLRRRKLGLSSCRGLMAYLTGTHPPLSTTERDEENSLTPLSERSVSVWRADKRPPSEAPDTVIRWGCTSNLPWTDVKVVNQARAIHAVNNKLSFVETMNSSHPTLQPTLITSNGTGSDEMNRSENYPMVVRPRYHAQGRKLWIARSREQLNSVVQSLRDGWYARTLVNKTAEYRIFVVCGRVVNVSRKTPGNPDDIAWNVARGGRFDNVRWDDWPLYACAKALKAFELSGLDFGGVDVMMDEDGQSWVIEINSAPSLPMNEDGTPTYRQKCMAQAFAYHLDNNNWDQMDQPESVRGWRDVIHPGMWRPRDER